MGRQPGYAVLQLFVTRGGRRVLVDRGDIDHRSRQETLARVVATNPRQVTGQLRPLPESEVRPPVDPNAEYLVWPRKSLRGIHGWVKTATPDVYLRAGPALAEGAPPQAAEGQDLKSGYTTLQTNWDSLHYALQWFAMALIVFALWLWATFGKPWMKGVVP